MNIDMIKQYNMAIRSLKNSIADKKATLSMLVSKYQPAGIWDHGEELLEVQAEIDMLEVKAATTGLKLKVAREEVLGKHTDIDTTPKLF